MSVRMCGVSEDVCVSMRTCVSVRMCGVIEDVCVSMRMCVCQ